MGHDTHFLSRLQRLDDHRMLDLALGLYRDPRAVRVVLDWSSFDGESDRVALALDHGPKPAHIILARPSGRFVTCLAPGMAVSGIPVMPRSEVDVALELAAGLDRADARIAWNGGFEALLDAVLHRGRRVAREDFDVMYLLAPAMPSLIHESIHRALLVIEKGIKGARLADLDGYHPSLLALLRLYGDVTIGVEQLMLLDLPAAEAALAAGDIDAALLSTAPFVAIPELSTAARAATIAARLGPGVMDGYLEQWRRADRLQSALDPWVSLVALAARFPETRRDVFAALAAPPPWAAELLGALEGARRMVEAPERVEAELRAEARRALAREGVEDPDEALIDASIGARNASLLGPMAARDRLPPVVVWAARRSPHDYTLPAARLEGLPEHVLPRAIPVGNVRNRLRDFYTHYRRLAARAVDDGPFDDREPAAPSGPKPGRNAPCPCGSGRKYKQCCLRKLR